MDAVALTGLRGYLTAGHGRTPIRVPEQRCENSVDHWRIQKRDAGPQMPWAVIRPNHLPAYPGFGCATTEPELEGTAYWEGPA